VPDDAHVSDALTGMTTNQEKTNTFSLSIASYGRAGRLAGCTTLLRPVTDQHPPTIRLFFDSENLAGYLRRRYATLRAS